MILPVSHALRTRSFPVLWNILDPNFLPIDSGFLYSSLSQWSCWRKSLFVIWSFCTHCTARRLLYNCFRWKTGIFSSNFRWHTEFFQISPWLQQLQMTHRELFRFLQQLKMTHIEFLQISPLLQQLQMMHREFLNPLPIKFVLPSHLSFILLGVHLNPKKYKEMRR